MTDRFHLTDGTTIDSDLYATKSEGTVYGIFPTEGVHVRIPVDQIVRIEPLPRKRTARWYDLPMAAGMWQSDGLDLRA